MTKNPLKALFVESLGEPFYLNVVQFKNEEKWFPMFHTKWSGSEKRSEAVKLRKEASDWLHNHGNKEWKDGKNIKTVKVIHYQSK
jgi:hypothetical protein